MSPSLKRRIETKGKCPEPVQDGHTPITTASGHLLHHVTGNELPRGSIMESPTGLSFRGRVRVHQFPLLLLVAGVPWGRGGGGCLWPSPSPSCALWVGTQPCTQHPAMGPHATAHQPPPSPWLHQAVPRVAWPSCSWCWSWGLPQISGYSLQQALLGIALLQTPPALCCPFALWAQLPLQGLSWHQRELIIVPAAHFSPSLFPQPLPDLH